MKKEINEIFVQTAYYKEYSKADERNENWYTLINIGMVLILCGIYALIMYVFFPTEETPIAFKIFLNFVASVAVLFLGFKIQNIVFKKNEKDAWNVLFSLIDFDSEEYLEWKKGYVQFHESFYDITPKENQIRKEWFDLKIPEKMAEDKILKKYIR